MVKRNGRKHYVVCLSNEGYKASLVVRRIYQAIADREALKRGLIRVIDESGEDYLFPEALFEELELSQTLKRKLSLAT